MAKATGFTCDNPECGKFLVGDSLPAGWLVLAVALEKGIGGQDRMELCSNFCLAQLAVARTEAEGRPLKGTKPSGRRLYKSEEARLRAQENGRRTTHKVHHADKGVLVEGCTYCEESTVPA